jgi:hypothetical protein
LTEIKIFFQKPGNLFREDRLLLVSSWPVWILTRNVCAHGWILHPQPKITTILLGMRSVQKVLCPPFSQRRIRNPFLLMPTVLCLLSSCSLDEAANFFADHMPTNLSV